VSFAGAKKFAVSVLKLGCGIAVAALIIGLAIWGFNAAQERFQESANAPLAALKTWPESPAISNTKLHMRTVGRSGSVFYQVDVDGYPPVVRRSRETAAQAGFNIEFLDKDGFRLSQHRLPLTEMIAAIGPDGEPGGLSWKGDEVMSADTYRRASIWDVSWSGFAPEPPTEHSIPLLPPARPRKQQTATPDRRHGSRPTITDSQPLPPPPTVTPDRQPEPRWKDVSVWRSLKHGLSKDDVKRILGEPSKVADFGALVTWYYGYPVGGQVTFRENGSVQSWIEP